MADSVDHVPYRRWFRVGIPVVNPEHDERQVQGATVQAVGGLMMERVSGRGVDDGGGVVSRS